MSKKWKSIAAWILIAGLCTCSIQAGAAEIDDTSSGAITQPDLTEEPNPAEEPVQDGGDGPVEDGTGNTEDENGPEGDISSGHESEESPEDSGSGMASDQDGTVEPQMQQMLTDSNYPAGCGSLFRTMPFTEGSNGEQIFLTLVDNQDFRWNINGAGMKNNVAHLDDVEGENCTFRLTHVENEWYGIKFIKKNGIDRHLDVDGKSTKDGAVLHIWEDSDDKLKNEPHRQFAFYDAGKDAVGNQMYYIKVRKSGLWVGLEHNTIATHQNLVQTTADKARRWYITPCVVPISGNEYVPWMNENVGIYCEIFRRNSMNAVNVMWKSGSAEINGMLLNSFALGSHSKWMLRYLRKYDAYTIESVNQGFRIGVEPTNNVWDVSGESGGDTHLNLWEKQSKNKNYNTSQLWRFVGTSSKDVVIQNARSGRYVYFKRDAGNDVLQQGSTSDHFELSLISVNAAEDESPFLTNGVSDTVSESMNWMGDIPDSALISSVNIPGTHDTGTACIVEDQAFGVFDSWSLTQCQKYFYEEQLTTGIRSFDIRCSARSDNSKADDVMIIHGSDMWQCYDRWGKKLNLKQILDTSGEFLHAHPTETIVMKVGPNGGSTPGLIRALAEYMRTNPELFWQQGRVPTMGEARGKIVLVSCFAVNSKDIAGMGGVEVSWFGPQLEDWGDYDYSATKGLVDISGDSGYRIYVQDAYNELSASKEKYIEGAINDSSGNTIPGNAYIWNFTTSALGFPLELTRDINAWMWANSNSGGLFSRGRMGMVLLNFSDIMLTRRIYQSNDNAGFFTAGCTFPTSVEVTYGETMSEARFGGQSGDGTFVVDGADKDYRPVVDDAGKKEVTVRFIPNASNMGALTQKVKITRVLPRPVTVTVPAQTYEYGEEMNLVYHVNEAQLAQGDTEKSLGISLKLQCEKKTGSGQIPAGTYDISHSDNNKNYVFAYDLNKVTITPRPVKAIWSDTKNIVKGQPDEATWAKKGADVHVTQLDGVLDGDRCSAAVTGGNEKEASWKGSPNEKPVQYTAAAALSGDDAGSYQITENTAGKKYYIRRPNADDYCLPESATVIYGQPLAGAVLDGASGDGEFIFYSFEGNDINSDNINSMRNAMDDVLDVKEDGAPYIYFIWYRPANTSDSHGFGKQIPVTVLPKPITVKASNAVKTYGDPAIPYSYDTDAVLKQLEREDTPDSLGITLNAQDGSGNAITEKTPVGIYLIKGTAGNKNYEVTVKPGILKVTCKEAVLAWTGYEALTYTGSPVNVTASVSNLISGDTCEVEVVNGQRTNAGTYKAVAVRLGNPNYKLTQNSNLGQSYTIEKAIPEISWPTVSLTYGQTLAEGSMSDGQANVGGIPVDGEFIFQDESMMPVAADSGKTGYAITFYPTDTRNYEAVSGIIQITVNRKALTVQMLNKEKIYGDELAAGSLPVYYDKSELVGEDILVIQPMVINESGTSVDPTYADAGTHRITAYSGILSQSNPNYKITVQEGTLTVHQRPVILQWSDVSNIVYNEPDPAEWNRVGADVTVSIKNLVERPDGSGTDVPDDCSVVVEGGDEKEPSRNGAGDSKVTIYHAVAKRLEGAQSKNYTFSEEEPDVPDEPLKNIDVYRNSRLQPYVIRMAEDSILPFAAVMTYGETFTEARMLAGSGEGTFEIVDKDGSSIDAAAKINAGIYTDTYKVKFTPDEPEKDSVVSQDYIALLVRKAPLTVTARDARKNYGDGKPDYQWDVPEEDLVAGDRSEDLLTARSVCYEREDEDDSSKITGEISGDEANSGIGVYDIVLEEQKNMNYDLTFLSAALIIDPKPVEIVWSDTSHIVYGCVDGEKNLPKWQEVGANVTAAAKNLLEGDSCNLTCAGGNRKNAGTYWAIVTGLDNENYCLPLFENAEEYKNTRMLQYTILKADPEVVFPKKLYARQGEVLGGLTHNGSADVPGTFAFEAADTVLRRSGTYRMIFTPDDTQNYNLAEAMVEVIVSGKPGGGNDTDDNDGNNGNGGSDTDDGSGGSGTVDNNGGAGTNGTGAGSADGSDAKKAGSPMTADNSRMVLYAVLILLSIALAMTRRTLFLNRK